MRSLGSRVIQYSRSSIWPASVDFDATMATVRALLLATPPFYRRLGPNIEQRSSRTPLPEQLNQGTNPQLQDSSKSRQQRQEQSSSDASLPSAD